MVDKKDQPVTVIATKDGFFGGRRRRAGSVFQVSANVKSHWLEYYNSKAPEKPKAHKEPETLSEIAKKNAPKANKEPETLSEAGKTVV